MIIKNLFMKRIIGAEYIDSAERELRKTLEEFIDSKGRNSNESDYLGRDVKIIVEIIEN